MATIQNAQRQPTENSLETGNLSDPHIDRSATQAAAMPPPLDVEPPPGIDQNAEELLDMYALGLKPGEEISGEELMKLIDRVTCDLDGNAAAGEYKALAAFVGRNIEHMSPEALQVFAAYHRAAKESQAQGSSGISPERMEQAFREMRDTCDRGSAGPSRSTPQTYRINTPQEVEHDIARYLEDPQVKGGKVLADPAAREALSILVAADLAKLRRMMQEQPETRLISNQAFDALYEMRVALDSMAEFERSNTEQLAKIDQEQDPFVRDSVRIQIEAAIESMKFRLISEFAKDVTAARRELAKLPGRVD